MNYKLLFAFFIFFIILGPIRSFTSDFTKEQIIANLSRKVYSIDSNASAIVLFEKITNVIGHEYNTTKTTHRIIKILKSDALHYSDVSVFYRLNDFRNYFQFIKGVTYNLKDGKVVERQVEKSDLLSKQVSRNNFKLNFALPDVKIGSIIEYEFDEVTENVKWFYTWEIQDYIPKLISEFQIIYPDNLDFGSVSNVQLPETICSTVDDAINGHSNFCKVLYEQRRDDIDGFNIFWLRKNVQGLKNEPLVVNQDNYREQVDVKLTGYRNTLRQFDLNNTWEKLNDQLWRKENMKKEVAGRNNFLNTVIDSLLKTHKGKDQIAKAIFNFVRCNFIMKEKPYYREETSVKELFENKEGTRAQINLLLTAMMVKAGLNASPVILGNTEVRSNVKLFPIELWLNRIVATVNIDDSDILLDASDKYNPYGRLEVDCYNGFAWIIGNKGRLIELTNEQLTERSATGVRIGNFKETSAQVEITLKLGSFQSQQTRKKWLENEDRIQEFIGNCTRDISGNLKYISHQIENKNDPDTNLVVKLNYEMNFERNPPSIFINSLIVNFLNTNPIKDIKRTMPFEYPFKIAQQYYLSVELPKGYLPDTLSKPMKISYDSGSIVLRKTTTYSESAKILTVNASLSLNKTRFNSAESPDLRSFYQMVINENNEIINLKKSSR